MSVFFAAQMRCNRCGARAGSVNRSDFHYNARGAARVAHNEAAAAGWFDIGPEPDQPFWRRVLCDGCEPQEVIRPPPLKVMLQRLPGGCDCCGTTQGLLDAPWRVEIGLEGTMICQVCLDNLTLRAYYDAVFARRRDHWMRAPLFRPRRDPADESMFTLEESNG